jgi:hypothetical protein
MNFLTSGSLGDIIYALPTIRQLGGGTVYVKESYFWPPYGSLYSAIKDLLLLQPYIDQVKPYGGQYAPFHYDPKIHIDFDLDLALNQPLRGRNHNIKSCLNAFNLSTLGWSDPWLIIDDKDRRQDPYSVIHLTPRWRDHSMIDWERIYMNIPGKVYFVGFSDEHADFCQKYGRIEHRVTSDILELARVIRDCRALYCNQSVSLTIAQGLGKTYWLEQKPTKTNCLMYTTNENILK